MARDYTALPFEYLEEMDYLSDAEYGRLIRALQHYSITGEEPDKLSGQEKGHWKRVRNREDRYRESFDTADRAKSERGTKAANARWSKAKNANASESNTVNANACVSMLGDAWNANTETKAETKAKANNNPATAAARAPAREEGPVGEESAGEEQDPIADPEFGRVMSYFMDHINPLPSSISVSSLKHFTDVLCADEVVHAMQICQDARHTTWPYLRKILVRYEREGVRTMLDVQRDEEQRDAGGGFSRPRAPREEPVGGFGLVDLDASVEPAGGLVADCGRSW